MSDAKTGCGAFLVLTLALAGIVSACGQDDDGKASNNDEKPRNAPKNPALGDREEHPSNLKADYDLTRPGKAGTGTVQLAQFHRGTLTEDDGYAYPVPYVQYKLTFHNTSKRSIDLADFMTNCHYGPKNVATASVETDTTSPIESNRVAPGSTVSENHACRFPASAKELKVEVLSPGDTDVSSSTTFGGQLPK